MRKFGKIVLGTMAVIATAAVIGSMSNGSEASSTPAGSSTAAGSSSAASDPSGPVAAGQVVNLDGVQVSTSPLKAVKPKFGNPALCTDVAYVNGTDDTYKASPMDWKLQDPNGAATNLTFTSGVDMFRDAELAAGGKASGTVCFDDPGTKGDYTVLYDSMWEWSADTTGFVTTR